MTSTLSAKALIVINIWIESIPIGTANPTSFPVLLNTIYGALINMISGTHFDVVSSYLDVDISLYMIIKHSTPS